MIEKAQSSLDDWAFFSLSVVISMKEEALSSKIFPQ